jgi:enediyne biosynthesis protein E4
MKTLIKLKRRKKNMAYISIFGLFFFSALAMIFGRLLPASEIYRPGERIDGLTSSLERSIPGDHPEVIFKDVTEAAGIRFMHFPYSRTTQLPEDMGSGASWGDYDNDGWDDLFIANFSGNLEMDVKDIPEMASCQLYRNNRNGSFTEVGQKTGLNIKGHVYAGTWLDYDNDGNLDILLTTYGGLLLYRNSGQGIFTDVTEKSGLEEYSGFWTGTAAGDFDGNGFVDIYVCGYVDYNPGASSGASLQYMAEVPASINPSSFLPIDNLLLRNNADGSFKDVAGIAGVKNGNGRSLSAAWIDLDEDGWLDLYVANDVSDNAFFRNKGDGTFEDLSYASLVADYRGAMGIGIGDWDNDQDMDLFITHWMAQENALYSNLRSQLASMGDSLAIKPRFMDEADRYGLGQSALNDIGFGTAFLDFDNDGRLDLFIANGSTFQMHDNPEHLVPMQDRLFWNRGPEEGFYDISGVGGAYFSYKFIGRGVSVSDYDHDGDEDLYISNHGGPGILLRNDGGNDNNWFRIRFLPADGKMYKEGVRLILMTGNEIQVRQSGSQGSYLSQHSLTVHFGLGDHESVDTLKVIWPDGKTDIYTRLQSNSTLEISILNDEIQ